MIVTGGNSGIGLETAKDLANRGAKVILACRSVRRGQAAKEEIIKFSGNTNVTCKQLDLASFRSIRDFCEDILKNEQRLDVLIIIMPGPAGSATTKHQTDSTSVCRSIISAPFY